MRKNQSMIKTMVESILSVGATILIHKVTSAPHLVFMFLFTLTLTISLSFLMIYSVFQGIYHKVIGSILSLYVIYRFISLGLSSPGLAVETVDQFVHNQMFNTSNFLQNLQNSQNGIEIQTSNSPAQNFNQLQQYHSSLTNNHTFSKIKFHHYCNQCKIPVHKGTKHCKTCKTCINGFDHHCIWIGKCIGKKNMWQFKDFLCFVFLTLIYALILSIQNSKIQRIS